MSDRSIIKKNLYIWILLGIVLFTILVYSNSIGNGFVDFDDTENVVDNISIREFNLRNLTHYFTTPLQFMYTPLVFVSYAIDYQIGKASPWIYHAHNLFLHICNILLVFWIFKKFTKQDFIALFIACIFAIHPVNVDGVSWISTRSNLLATFFFLGALAFYTQYIESGKLWQLALSVFVFLLATFSKSAAVTLSVTLFLWDYFAGRKLYTKKTGFRNLLEKIPFLVIAIVMGIVTLNFRVDEYHLYDYNLLDRFFVFCTSMAGYFFKLLAPFGLSFSYAYPAKTGGFLPWYTYLLPAVLCLLVWGLYKLKVPIKILIFGFGFFLINIFLTQSTILIDNFQANRYAYLPFIGLYFIPAWSLNTLVVSPRGATKGTKGNKGGKGNKDAKGSKVAKGSLDNKGPLAQVNNLAFVWMGIPVLFIILFAFLTYNRNFLWKDTVSLMNNSITNQKDVPFTYSNRGITKYKNGDYTGALADFNQTISLDPGFTLAYNYRGLTKGKLGDKEGALADFNKAIACFPNSPDVYNNRGSLKQELQDYNGALADFTKSIQLNSNFVDARFNRGLLFINSGDCQAALQDYNIVISQSPDYANAYNNRGIAELCLGDNQNAVFDFDKALSLNPQFPDAFYNRGLAKANLGDTASACTDWKHAASLGFARANNLLEKACN